MSEQTGSDETIFAAALQWETPAQRAAYLDEACAGDPALRARVEALLRASEAAHSFLEQPIGVPPQLAHTHTASPTEIGFVDLQLSTEGPGGRIGRYKLLQQIGEGGCGTVFMAEQEEPVRRRVALKVIKPGMDTKQVVARFEAERQALAMMDHPNIAKVLDAGMTEHPHPASGYPLPSSDEGRGAGGEGRPQHRTLTPPLPQGRPYFVMELVRGIPITRYCDENKLDTRARLDLFIKVCQAIQHAHQKGIIHRDIKPSNILVTLHDGVPVPKVIDFGIAKAIEGRLTNATLFTAFEQFIGTPAYMSPEQAEMSGLDIDTRSDIYSLGVLLYELLTGVTPFDGRELIASGLDGMRKTIREKEPVRPSTRLTQLQARSATPPLALPPSRFPSDLDWIVMKCLEKDRQRRYETANDLAADLKRHLNNEPVTARPPSVAYRFQKAFRRNKLIFASGAVVVVALVAGLCVAAFGWRQARAERDNALHARQEAQASEQQAVEAGQRAQVGEQEARRSAALARRMAYVADMAQARQATADGDLHRARTLLDRYRPKNGEEEIRGFEWRHLWAESRSDETARLGGYGGFLKGLALSPDGAFLASTTSRGVEIRSFPNRALILTLTNADEGPIQFSQDSQRLVTGGTNGLVVWNTRTWQQEGFLPRAGAPFAFARNGEILVTGQGDRLVLWSSRDLQKVADLPGTVRFDGFSKAMAVSPDGNRIYFGEDSLIRGWDLTTRTELPPIRHSEENFVTTLAVSPQGMLAASHWYGQVTLWDLETQQLLHTFGDHLAWVSGVEFSTDGARLATASADRNIFLYETQTRKLLHRFKGHEGEIWALQYSADGRWLVSGGKNDNSVRLWEITDRTRETGPAETSDPLGFIGSGLAVVSASERGFTRTDLRTGSTELMAGWPDAFERPNVKRRDYLEVRVTSVIASPDGTRAAGIPRGGTRVQVWNILSRSTERILTNSPGPIGSFVFTPDGNHLVVSGPGWQTHLWNLTDQSFRPINDSGSTNVARLTVSFDGSRLAQVGSDRAEVLELASGKVLLRVQEPGVIGLALSSDGTMLAMGSLENLIHLWDVDRGRKIETLRGHVAGVWGLAFSPDGRTLASCGDSQVKLWNLGTRQEMLTLARFSSPPSRILFSPDGSGLVTSLSDGRTQYWTAPSFEEIAAMELKEQTESRQP